MATYSGSYPYEGPSDEELMRWLAEDDRDPLFVKYPDAFVQASFPSAKNGHQEKPVTKRIKATQRKKLRLVKPPDEDEVAEEEQLDLPIPLGEFLDDYSDKEYDWVIDTLLERGDRFVITGGEGDGKSTWILQFGIKCAAGIHPTTDEPMEPLVVLHPDLENGTGHLAREANKMVLLLTPEQAQNARENYHIRSLPEGVDLSTTTDQKRLESWCKLTDPDLLLIGPRYKMLGNEDDKQAAREVQAFLDHIRVTYTCAIGTESHMPHANNEDGSRVTREYGTSSWLRWPEFGMNLRHDGEIVHYRRPRDKRPWPTRWERLTEQAWEAGSDWPWRPTEHGTIKFGMRLGGEDSAANDLKIAIRALVEHEETLSTRSRGYDDAREAIAGALTGSNTLGRAVKVMKTMREEGYVDSPGYFVNEDGLELLETPKTG